MPADNPFRRRIPAVLALFVLICFLRFPDTVSETAADAMTRCARDLIPLLFPYMVLSALAVRRDLTAPLTGLLRFLGLPEPGILFLGLLAGFPAGALSAAELYREGRIGKREAEILAAASSVPSPAFLPGAVGVLWGDARFGRFLTVTAWATLCLYGRIASGRRPGTVSPRYPKAPARSFAADCSDAVAKAGTGCLGVTASVTFFRILGAVGRRLLPPLAPLFALLFEFSSGAAAGAGTGGIPGAVMTGAALGFSGLAVLMQIGGPVADAGLSVKPYLFSRLLLGTVLAAAAAGYAALHPMTPVREALAPLGASGRSAAAALLLPAFLAAAGKASSVRSAERRSSP